MNNSDREWYELVVGDQIRVKVKDSDRFYGPPSRLIGQVATITLRSQHRPLTEVRFSDGTEFALYDDEMEKVE